VRKGGRNVCSVERIKGEEGIGEKCVVFVASV
jgi:hypothetical protein